MILICLSSFHCLDEKWFNQGISLFFNGIEIFWVKYIRNIFIVGLKPIQRIICGLFFIFSIDENVVQIYNNKNRKLFYDDLVYIALERDQYISQSIRHSVILEIAIVGFEGCFLLIAFLNPHLEINICEIKLNKTLSLAKLIQ